MSSSQPNQNMKQTRSTKVVLSVCLSVCPSSVIHHYRCHSVATVRRYIHASKTYFQIQSEKKNHSMVVYTCVADSSPLPTLHPCWSLFTPTNPSPVLLMLHPAHITPCFINLTLTSPIPILFTPTNLGHILSFNTYPSL